MKNRKNNRSKVSSSKNRFYIDNSTNLKPRRKKKSAGRKNNSRRYKIQKFK